VKLPAKYKDQNGFIIQINHSGHYGTTAVFQTSTGSLHIIDPKEAQVTDDDIHMSTLFCLLESIDNALRNR